MSPLLGIYASSNYQRVVPDNGAMFPIAMVNVGSAGTSAITFSNIPATYKHLQIRGIAKTSTNVSLGIRFNSDTGSNYARHYLNGNGSSAGAGGSGSTTSAYAGTAAQASSTFGANIIDILDYASTSKYKTVKALSGADANGSGFLQFMSGLWQNTNAITSISIIQVDGDSFQEYSQFGLFGIKG
jgi:hypothetical protein